MKNNTYSKFFTIYILGFAWLFSIFFSLFNVSQTASAETTTDKVWSWTENSPQIISSIDVTPPKNPSDCRNGSLRNIKIDNEVGYFNACAQNGSNISFNGTQIAGKGYVSTVGFNFDDTTYKLRGICESPNNCLYVPEKDILVTRPNIETSLVKALVIYRNFSQRLKPIRSAIDLQYEFDDSSPDYVFQSAEGYHWPVEGLGISRNGQWLAIELRDKGFGLLNLDNFVMKRITTEIKLTYGHGYNPTVEMAVSEDGKHVAITGHNSGLTILDITNDCGDNPTTDNMLRPTPIAKQCPQSVFNTDNIVSRFRDGYSPRFEDSGGELTFFADSYNNDFREVAMRASGYQGDRLDYLALGDSFTSGEGESDDKYYLTGTKGEIDKCHVSYRSYPFIITASQDIDANLMRSVACSGATTGDIIGNDTDYIGQNDRLKISYPGFIKRDLLPFKTQAKFAFSPGIVLQEAFVKYKTPKVITVGIGGNDAKLIDKLASCVSPSTCDIVTDQQELSQTAGEIKNTFNNLVNTYQKLQTDSPKTKIYAIGYPQIISANQDCNNFLTGVLLDQAERQFMNEGISYINQVIESAAKAAGIKYIDIEHSFGDNLLCNSNPTPAMNDIRTGDDFGLIDINVIKDWTKFLGNESFHPTAVGHQLIANTINQAVNGSLLNYNYCENNNIYCPDTSITAPDPPAYWPVTNLASAIPTQYSVNFLTDIDNLQKQAKVESYSFTPNSEVQIEITSTPQSLGTFLTDSFGGIETLLQLPNDLMEGYHTVHIYGTSYTGQAIEIYQIIKYEKPQVAPEITSTPNETAALTDTGLDNNDALKNLGIEKNDNANEESAPSATTSPLLISVNNHDQLAVTGPIETSLVSSLVNPITSQLAETSTRTDQSLTNNKNSQVLFYIFIALTIATLTAISALSLFRRQKRRKINRILLAQDTIDPENNHHNQ